MPAIFDHRWIDRGEIKLELELEEGGRKEYNYQDAGGGVVEASGSGGEGDSSGELVDGAGLVEVGGDGGGKAEGLGDEVGSEASIGKPARGEAIGVVAAVGPEVAPGDGRDEVVVARVHGRVAEHDDRRHLRLLLLLPGHHRTSDDDEQQE